MSKPKKCVIMDVRTEDGREVRYELCVGDKNPVRERLDFDDDD